MGTDIEQVHRDDLADAIRHTPKRPTLSTIEQVRKIVESRQCARVGGVLVDGFTASAIIQVYDRLNDENKAKLAALPIRKMADTVWKIASGKGR